MGKYKEPRLKILNDPYEWYEKGEITSIWEFMETYVKDYGGDEKYGPFEGMTIPEALDRLEHIVDDWQVDFDFIIDLETK